MDSGVVKVILVVIVLLIFKLLLKIFCVSVVIIVGFRLILVRFS